MITHAHDCARPLPGGIGLSCLLSVWASPPDTVPPKRCVKTMTIATPAEAKDDESIPAEAVEIESRRVETLKANNKTKRIERFGKVMRGRGPMSRTQIATPMHKGADDLAASLAILCNDGNIKRIGEGKATRYEWVMK